MSKVIDELNKALKEKELKLESLRAELDYANDSNNVHKIYGLQEAIYLLVKEVELLQRQLGRLK